MWDSAPFWVGWLPWHEQHAQPDPTSVQRGWGQDCRPVHPNPIWLLCIGFPTWRLARRLSWYSSTLLSSLFSDSFPWTWVQLHHFGWQLERGVLVKLWSLCEFCIGPHKLFSTNIRFWMEWPSSPQCVSWRTKQDYHHQLYSKMISRMSDSLEGLLKISGT